MVIIDLKPNGADIRVTEENKKGVEYQIKNHFMSGFSELIPQDRLMVFDELWLALFIGGIPEIDVYVLIKPVSSVLLKERIILYSFHRDNWGPNSQTIEGMKSTTK